MILAMPLETSTTHLVDDAFLSHMQDGSLLVNVDRGGVVDTAALLDHLRRRRIYAALDVTEPEPLPPDHSLRRAPEVLTSPHVGGDSTAFTPRARRLVNSQLHLWAWGMPLHHTVNRG